MAATVVRESYFRSCCLKKSYKWWLYGRLNGRHAFRRIATTSVQLKPEEEKTDEKMQLKRERKAIRWRELSHNMKMKQKREQAQKDSIAEYTGDTKPGEKKDTTIPLPPSYSSRYVEAAWYDWWMKKGFFQPDYNQRSGKESDKAFVIVLPPPNVTGTLHLGHVLGNSIQDAVIRWHRMNGNNVLWNPGCDHAGIATQVRVEKKLWAEEKKTRHDIGREQFVQKVWDWKNEKGTIIYDQMRRLGSALDWSRACFTMDPKMCRAVNEAFIRLYNDGLIYRSKRMVNWSCALKSAISDLEVEHTELEGKTKLEVPGHEHKVEFGVLTSFAYPVVGKDAEIVVATTRPETMLGDTAIAVHPDDPRYTSLHGLHAQHPFCDRTIPIICDPYVDQEFGTGAVKITPAHDVNDYEIGLRHKLPLLDVISDEGTLINVPQEFQGMPRLKARRAVVKALHEKGLHRGEKSHAMSVPTCSRSNDVIEPRLKDQWYVNCKDMARKAIKAVDSGRLEIIPCNYVTAWKSWLDGHEDWCISRQLWWGHQVPAYRVIPAGESEPVGWVCAHTKEEALKKACDWWKCSEKDCYVTQDEDVLDTWFSSALFPFAIFGWPEKTEDFEQFYPTSLLETASDIMFFWVARMVMLGEKLTGQLPFNQVLFHSILRDTHGRKMSKSLGNVIDPMDVINGISLEDLHAKLEKDVFDEREVKKAKEGQVKEFPLGIKEVGSDALRFTMCGEDFKSPFIKFDMNNVHDNRLFCNKVFHTFRYVSQVLGDDFIPTSMDKMHSRLSRTDLWLLSCISNLVEVCDESFHTYDLFKAKNALKTFWKDQFSNMYCEYVKVVLNGEDGNRRNDVKNLLLLGVDTGIRALSPFMPYLSEELYQRLPLIPQLRRPESVCVAPYPSPSQYTWRDAVVEKEVESLTPYVAAYELFKQMYRLTPRARPNVFLRINEVQSIRHVISHRELFEALVLCKSVAFLSPHDKDPPGCCDMSTENGDRLYLQLKGLVNVEQQKGRLLAQLEKHSRKYEEKKHELEREDLPEVRSLMLNHKLNELQTQKSQTEIALKLLEKLD